MRQTLCMLMITAFYLCRSFSQPASAEEFRFLSMWRSDGEMRALDRLVAAADSIGVHWVNQHADNNFAGTRAQFIREMLRNEAPNGVQWIVGAELRSLVDAGIIEPMHIPEANSRNLFVPELTNAIFLDDDRLTILPVSIHIQNHMLVNLDVLQHANVPVPKTIGEFIAALPQLKKAGFIPVSLSDQSWQMRNLFLAILSTLVDKDQFDKMLFGDLPKDMWVPVFIKSFQYLDDIRDNCNSDHQGLSWQDATHKVLEGKAAFQILGDYVGSEITEEGPYACRVFPGAQFLLWGADGIAFTRPPTPEYRQKLTELVIALSKTALSEGYTYEKGGIPVVQHFSTEKLKRCSQNNVADWQRYDERRVWLSGEIWQTKLETLGTIVASFMNDHSEHAIEDHAQRLYDALVVTR